MLRKRVKYVDYNGTEREETLLFNLSTPELMRLEFGTQDGIEATITKFVDEENASEIMKFFELIISMAYGEKSEDGRHFTKSEELSEQFLQSSAYETLYEELLSDTDAAIAFFNGIVPKVKSAKTQRTAH